MMRQPPKEKLKETFDTALFGENMGDKTDMVYWSDVFHKGEGFILASPAELLKKVKGANRFQSKMQDSSRAFWQYAFKRLNLERVAREKNEKLRIAKPLANRITTGRILRKFLPEVAMYFYDEERREEIKNRFKTTLNKVDGECIIISHSMGTIISYDVLRDFDDSSVSVTNLITMGSPLGMPSVQRQLLESGKTIEGEILPFPPVVQNWINVYDFRDPVTAGDRTLDSSLYEKGTEIKDFMIPNAAEDPHWAEGYLKSAPVKKLLLQYHK